MNDFKELLQHFITFKLNDNIILGFGGNEDGECSSLTLDEFNTDSMLSLKLYKNHSYVFENEFWDDNGNPILQVIYLDNAGLEIVPLKLQLMMQEYLLEQLAKYS